MKSMILLVFIAVVSADEFHMTLNEKGENFQEDIKIDVAGNTEEIKVPQHQDRNAVDILNDFNMGLTAMKIPAEQACYISKIDTSEQSPQKMKKSMELAKSRFPTERYMVESFQSLIVRRMTAEEVGEKIAAHCKGLDLIHTINFNKENIEDEAVKLAKSIKRQGRFKRQDNKDGTLVEFFTCDINTMRILETCQKEKVGARCTFWRTDRRVCAYRVTCDPDPASNYHGARCKGSHRFNLNRCCDFVCMP